MGKIADSFAKMGLLQSFDARIEEISKGRVVISAPITPAVSQQHGFAHAGLSFALGDSAAGYSAATYLPDDVGILTVEMKINLIAPAAGVRLFAIGEVVKPGRKLLITRATVEAEHKDGTRREVALLQGTMIPFDT